MNTPEQYVYRVALFLSPGATVIGLATLAASDGGSGISNPEWVMAVVATITAAAAQAGQGALSAPAARVKADARAQRRLRPA
jgi:hypothetical protein